LEQVVGVRKKGELKLYECYRQVSNALLGRFGSLNTFPHAQISWKL